ncbi:MAG TPA: PEGA domain-containing protein [Trueperaceae bacterium]|nr:PEGA domain-containing protein [Trueperaceae bacterium]
MFCPRRCRRTAHFYTVMALVAVLVSLGSAAAQISAPTFGTRGDVADEAVQRFMTTFRSAVGAETGMEVRNGELITPGIASSLEPEFTMLIAALDSARYAISGEIARVTTDPDAYTINLIVVDAERQRASDLISAAFDPKAPELAAVELAAAVAEFTTALLDLPTGDAGLFVSSEPGDAQVFVDGVSLGRTSQLDVAMLPPGRYQLEVRKEGFLPDVRMIELRSQDTSFVHVILTAIAGGSVQVSSFPPSRVELDGVASGTTPATLPALPGMHTVTLARDGFKAETVDVLVRNYRVSRVQTELTPVEPLVVFWEETREVLVFVDGVFQPGGHAVGIRPGLREFELRRGAARTKVLRAVPGEGVFRLDLTSGELVQYQRP